MKNFSPSAIAIFLFGFFISASAQHNVLPLPLDSNTTIKGYHLCYALKTTAIKVTVSATKVREIKGYYSDHAQSLLGLTHVIDENRTSYRLDKVDIAPIDIPDMDKRYMVILSGKQNKENLLAPSSKEQNANTGLLNLTSYTTQTAPIPDFFKNYADLSYTQTEDAFVETKIIDGVVTQVPANKTKVVSKTNSQKAQEAADAISKSRKDQYNLVAGEQETPYSAEAIRIMLAELKQWENNYLSLFTGITLEDEITYTFYAIPEGERTTLFTFNPVSGLSVEQADSASDTYILSLSPLYDFPSFCNENVSAQNPKTNGYRYRTAKAYKAALEHQGSNIHDFGILNMYQFGTIKVLPTGQDKLDIQDFGFIL